MRRPLPCLALLAGTVGFVVAVILFMAAGASRDLIVSAAVAVAVLWAGVAVGASEGHERRLKVVMGDAGAGRESAMRTIEGWFWFPPDTTRCFGSVEIGARDLHLTLRDSPRDLAAPSESVVIHGESLDGEELSLLRVFVTNRKDWVSFGHNRERYRASVLLIGTHVLAESELRFDRASLRLRGLTEWMSASSHGRTGLGMPRELAGGSAPSGLPLVGRLIDRLRARRRGQRDPEALPTPLKVPLNGATLTLGFTREQALERNRETTTYHAEAMFELSTPLSLDRWDEWLRPLQDLLVFATREQVAIESFVATLFDPADTARAPSRNPLRRRRPRLGARRGRGRPGAGGRGARARHRALSTPAPAARCPSRLHRLDARSLLRPPWRARRRRSVSLRHAQHAHHL